MTHEHPEIFDRLSCVEIAMLLALDGRFTLPAGSKSPAMRMAEARAELSWALRDEQIRGLADERKGLG